MAGHDRGWTLLDHFKLARQAALDPNVSKSAMAVLQVLIDHCFKGKDECNPGLDRIAAQTCQTPRSAMRAIQCLEAGAYAAVDRNGRSNRYRLNFELATGDNSVTSQLAIGDSSVTNRTATGDTNGATGDKSGPPMVTVSSPEALALEAPLLKLSKEQEQGRSPSEELVSLPAWMPEQTWQRWTRHKGPDYGPDQQRAALETLAVYLGDGHNPELMVNMAIAGNWKSLRIDDRGGQTRVGGTAHASAPTTDDRGPDQPPRADVRQIRSEVEDRVLRIQNDHRLTLIDEVERDRRIAEARAPLRELASQGLASG